QEFGKVHSDPPGLLEAERTSDERETPLVAGHHGRDLTHADRRRDLLPVHLGQLRLRVEQVDVARAAGLEGKNQPPGPGGGGQAGEFTLGRGSPASAAEEPGQRDAAEKRRRPHGPVAACPQLGERYGRYSSVIVSSRLSRRLATTVKAAKSVAGVSRGTGDSP